MRRTLNVFAPLMAILLVGLAGCDLSGGTQPTQVVPTELALVTGTVRDAQGQGISGAQVGLHLPADRFPLSYVSADAFADEAGDFQILIGRIGEVGDIPTPDTLTVWALAVFLNRVDSAQVQLRFSASELAPDPQLVDITLAVP